MKTLKDYADMILVPEPIYVKKTSELTAKFKKMADEIYNCKARNHNKRNYSNVYECVEKAVIEHALAQQTGMQLNPKDFDHTDRTSYAYDIIDLENGKTFECKRWAEKWFSFNERDILTFRKNIDIVDFLVSGKVFKTSTHYTVAFHLLANAKTFEKYVRPSQFTMKMYYDHKNAMKNGDAFFRENVHYTSEVA